MRAVVVDEADLTAGRSEADQVFAEESHAERCSVRLGELVGADGRQPVLPHEIAHRRARADTTQVLVVRLAQHTGILTALARWRSGASCNLDTTVVRLRTTTKCRD